MESDARHYWDDFYKRHAEREPSSFAKFCLTRFIRADGRLVELGFGSGRDLVYFANNGIDVTGYDTSHVAKSAVEEVAPHVNCLIGDFTTLPPAACRYVYSRWTMHSITEAQEERLLTWLGASLMPGGLFLAEARSTADPLFGEGVNVGRNAFVTDHYRRFINPDELLEKLRRLRMSPLYFEQAKGLSPAGEGDPHLFRCVARRF